MYDYGKRLTELRENHSVSARRLSQSLLVDPATISKIENGKAFPSVQLLDQICTYFKISYSDFFQDNIRVTPEEFNTLTLEEIISFYHIASDDDKTIVGLIFKKYKKKELSS